MAVSELTAKTIDVLEALATEPRSLPEIAQHCELATSTAHRIVQTLAERGYVIRVQRGRYRLGSAISALARIGTPHDLVADVARPILRRLSREVRLHTHMGVLEDDMVTYLIKLRYGKGRVHSAEGSQLEAYCSGLGKMLLASLSPRDLSGYIEGAPFVALTDKTIIDPTKLQMEIDAVRERGWAIDEQEIASDLICLAVPVMDRTARTIAAISVSNTSPSQTAINPMLPMLRKAAADITNALYPDRHLAI